MLGGIILVVVLVIAIGCAVYESLFLGGFPTQPKTYRKCSKQPDKTCPITMQFDARCGMHWGNHSKCCKVIDQIKAANEMGCKMEVGVDYNGMSITQGYKDSCLRSRERIQSIDSSGPLE